MADVGHLILSRMLDEKIYIDHPDGPIVITVCEVSNRGKCRLSVTAPKSVRVMRAELVDEPVRPEGVGHLWKGR